MDNNIKEDKINKFLPTRENPQFFEMSQPVDIQTILKQLDPLIVMQKIAKFRKLNFAKMTNAEIHQAIFDVLCWNGIFTCYTNIRSYPAETKFFRVKRLQGTTLPDPRFEKYDDYWETNPKYLKEYGRINKPGESLLYVSPDLQCCISELKIQQSEPFAIIQYAAKSEVKVNIIGGEFDYEQLGVFDSKVKLIHELYNSFLRDEFSRDVGKSTEYLYKISEAIAKDHFDLPPRIVQDAWAYMSVQDKTKVNVCFRPDIAHEILELNGAMISTLDNDNIKVHCVAVGKNDENDIIFLPLGSPEQKRVFPEITWVSPNDIE